MRRDVQEIFRSTPHGKQVMMFSATLSKEIRPVCKKFMQDVNITVLIILLLLPIRLSQFLLLPLQLLLNTRALNNISYLKNHSSSGCVCKTLNILNLNQKIIYEVAG